MKALKPDDKFNTALILLGQAREEAATLPPLSTLRTTRDLAERARIIRSVMNARDLFRQAHERAEGLSEALVRFEQRKRQINRNTLTR